MASTRAAEVAELLWELKRANKLATFSSMARRAGFAPGSNGRAVVTTLKAVRRGWPHLQWWRAVNDDGTLEKGSEHEQHLTTGGFLFQEANGKSGAVVLLDLDKHLIAWNETAELVKS